MRSILEHCGLFRGQEEMVDLFVIRFLNCQLPLIVVRTFSLPQISGKLPLPQIRIGLKCSLVFRHCRYSADLPGGSEIIDFYGIIQAMCSR